MILNVSYNSEVRISDKKCFYEFISGGEENDIKGIKINLKSTKFAVTLAVLGQISREVHVYKHVDSTLDCFSVYYSDIKFRTSR